MRRPAKSGDMSTFSPRTRTDDSDSQAMTSVRHKITYACSEIKLASLDARQECLPFIEREAQHWRIKIGNFLAISHLYS